jgi:hypothetical protein
MPEQPMTAHGQTHRVSFLALRSTHTATPKGNKARRALRPQSIVQASNRTEDHHIQKWHYIEVETNLNVINTVILDFALFDQHKPLMLFFFFFLLT